MVGLRNPGDMGGVLTLGTRCVREPFTDMGKWGMMSMVLECDLGVPACPAVSLG